LDADSLDRLREVEEENKLCREFLSRLTIEAGVGFPFVSC
jgi:hypothetical protein